MGRVGKFLLLVCVPLGTLLLEGPTVGLSLLQRSLGTQQAWQAAQESQTVPKFPKGSWLLVPKGSPENSSSEASLHSSPEK